MSEGAGTMEQITTGFIPLTDSMLLVAARECGFAEEEGISLVLVRETSWANIRDRVTVGHFDAAHMLAPMPVAASLGLTPLDIRIIAPMALGLGGNAITVSGQLWSEMADAGASVGFDPAVNGKALCEVAARRAKAGEAVLRFGVVHPFSGHNFELRYWLAACGIDPDKDIEIVIVPPPLMADALASGQLDGFCVGEPWNSVAVERGAGRIATVKAAIWKSSPEKVLGVRDDWAIANPDLLASLLRALYRASRWCEDPANHKTIATILARDAYLGVDAGLIARALSGCIMPALGAEGIVPDFFIPHRCAATFPWESHALWFYSQMVRWGLVGHCADNARVVRGVYRPDLYRAALAPLGAAMPSANAKVEGALARSSGVGSSTGGLSLGPDGFFDGKVFDPDDLDGYIADF